MAIYSTKLSPLQLMMSKRMKTILPVALPPTGGTASTEDEHSTQHHHTETTVQGEASRDTRSQG